MAEDPDIPTHTNPVEILKYAEGLGDFTDLGVDRDHSNVPTTFANLLPTSSSNRNKKQSGSLQNLKKSVDPSLGLGTQSVRVPPPPQEEEPAPPPPTKKNLFGGAANNKPMTQKEEKAWQKLIAIATKRKDGAVIASKIQQIQRYTYFFPWVLVDKFNPETVTIETLDLIIQTIENQLSQPHTRKTAKTQLMLLLRGVDTANHFFGLQLKTRHLEEIADLRYPILEPDWLELLIKYNLLFPSKVELRMINNLWETMTLAEQVETGKVRREDILKKMAAPSGFNDL